jgi:hypothetical protein
LLISGKFPCQTWDWAKRNSSRKNLVSFSNPLRLSLSEEIVFIYSFVHFLVPLIYLSGPLISPFFPFCLKKQKKREKKNISGSNSGRREEKKRRKKGKKEKRKKRKEK